MLIRFWKPYGVLPQFTDPDGRPTLADYIRIPNIYAAGRLDLDSEGLLLLTDEGALQQRLTDPRFEHPKTYFVQVEGTPDEEALAKLRQGITLNDGPTRPALAQLLNAPPDLPPRTPPIRHRLTVPTAWLQLTITEGRKRQVRRMTAAVGFPTLRLLRWAVGEITLEGLTPGQWHKITTAQSVWPAG
jgi:pseudouridine synthase